MTAVARADELAVLRDVERRIMDRRVATHPEVAYGVNRALEIVQDRIAELELPNCSSSATMDAVARLVDSGRWVHLNKAAPHVYVATCENPIDGSAVSRQRATGNSLAAALEALMDLMGAYQ